MAIDFSLKEFAHPFTIWRLHRILRRTQWLSPSDLASYQNRRLRKIVRHAYSEVPYYRKVFEEAGLRPDDIHTASDLTRIPRLSKTMVQRAGGQLHARRVNEYRPRTYKTSGTTGAPLRFLLDKQANALEFVYYWRHWSWAGYKLGDRFAELGTSFFIKRQHLLDAPAYWQPHFRRLMLNGTRLSMRDAIEMGAAMERHRPLFIKGMASSLFYLARFFDEAGVKIPPLKAAFSSGERISSDSRKLIENVFACPVLDTYGHMERTVAISQCLEGGYHVNADYGVLEIVDSCTRVGEAVGTSLYNLAMPLLRYEIGDHIEAMDDDRACPCGRGLPLVKAIHGRTADVVVTPDGRYLTAVFILPEFVEGVGFAQFIQDRKDRLAIHVVPAPGWNAAEQQKLEDYAAQLLGGSMQLLVRTVGPEDVILDQSGKRRVVISQIDT
ncbi:MAG: phenylacetate--CoA ligase family protein [Deltaproteobacteria bacterium]|nr:phenylacetate--CoA ligase family protein [Deltaproteobacteria bacterium]